MKVLVTAPLLGLLAACARGPAAGASGKHAAGRRDPGTAPRSNLGPVGYKGRYQAVLLVLEDATHGPQMCSYELTSYPPQCSGIDLVGWSWASVKHESAKKTRWGTYQITGRFDGNRFAVTEVAAPPPFRPPRPLRERGDRTPCPEPPGGWQPIDLAKATNDAMQAANALAQSSPDFAGLWIDQGQRVTEATANDPTQFILNVSFTGDVAGHTTRLREVWGGALCVSRVRYSEAQLSAIQAEVRRSLNGPASGIDVYTNSVTVEPWTASERQQKELDRKYGTGAVVVTAILRPID